VVASFLSEKLPQRRPEWREADAMLAPLMSTTFVLYLTAAATILYFLAGWAAARPARAFDRWLAPLALLLHLSILLQQLVQHGAIVIGIREALALFAWQSAMLLWLFCLRQPLRALGVVIYPLAGVGAALAMLMPAPVAPSPITDWKIQSHVVLSLFSAGLLTLAAVQALVLAVQDRLLHRHALIQSLPALQTMERLLFQLITLGFFLLSLTLLTGLLFIHDLLGQHLAHKTVLSVIAWLLFAVLLWGHRVRGWRGRAAVRWTLSGYGFLVLAYFGSKWVLEEVLHKQWS
jgi:ABC-type uncharacterized transport system permease subunit